MWFSKERKTENRANMSYMQNLEFRRFALAGSVLLTTLLVGCSVIFEEDIRLQDITLLTPSDGLTTNVQTNTFSWVDLPDAVAYRFQVATPNFIEPKLIQF